MNETRLPTLVELADTYEVENAASQADVLSPISAGLLEEFLQRNPSDLLNRARLLGFYYRYYWKTRTRLARDFRNRRVQHILWFIENAPGCIFAADRYLAVDKQSDEHNYSKVATAWQEAVRQTPHDSQVRINAALFFLKNDQRLCSSLLNSVKKDDPANVWIKAVASRLGAVKDVSDVYDLEPLALNADDSIDFRDLCNRSSLHRAFSAGEELSPISVETLTRVLSKYPNDVTARAELVAFYAHRCRRQNILGYDPASERKFTSNVLWFITHALGAESLSDIRVPELTPGARSLLCAALDDQMSRSKDHVGDNISKLADRLRGKTDQVKRRLAHAVRKRGRQINSPSALDEIAISPKRFIESSNRPGLYSLTEWANNCSMGSAELTGSYGWVAPQSIEHLDEMLDDGSIDLYNRAKIIGFYREPEKASNRDEKLRALYAKHLQWLISTVPDCEFLKEHYWAGLKKDLELCETIKQVWCKSVKAHPSAGSYVNASLAHFDTERKKARSFLVSALSLEPDNLMATTLLRKIDKQPQRNSSAQLLKRSGFKAGCKSNIISKASKRVDLVGAWLFGTRLPDSSVWTAEQVIQNNPNELVMRAELLGYYGDQRYCFALAGRDPKYSVAHLPHLLWFVQNIPETIGPRARGDYYQDPIGYRAMVAAWKQQLEAYPMNAGIAYSASWIFSGDSRYFEEGVTIVRRALKVHPKNERLKDRLKHLKTLSGIR
jgi:hypothetical protein